MKINEFINNNDDNIKPGDVLMIESDGVALVGVVLGVKDGAVLIEGDTYPLDEHDDDNVIRSLGQRQAQKNKTPYRYNADIAEQIPRYDSVKRRNIPAGFEMDNPNAVPYDRFEAVPVNDRIANIVGIAPDGGKVKISTTTRDAAIALADAYNRGGFTDQDIERVKFEEVKQRLDPKCWKGYRKQGTKVKDGVRVNNCVKVNETFIHVDRTLTDLKNFMFELKDEDFERAIYDLDQIVVFCQEHNLTPQAWVDEIVHRSKIPGILKDIAAIRTMLPNYEHETIKALLVRIKDSLGDIVKDDVDAIVAMLKFLGANWSSLDRVAAAAVKALPDTLNENNDDDYDEEELHYDAINHMDNLYYSLEEKNFRQAANYLSELGMLYQEAGVYLPDAIDMITDRKVQMHIEKLNGLLDDNKDDVIRGILTMIKTGYESSTSIGNLISVLDNFGIEWPELDTIEAAVIKSLPNRLNEAEYQGRKVQLGKPTRGDVRKYKVFVKDPKTGNIKKVNFGDPNMEIKRDDPARRKSFRARHGCGTPRASDRTKAAYWSCRMWSSKPVSKILKGK
jgi:hypothetical protein